MALPLIAVAIPAAMGAAGAAKMGKGAVDSGKANKIQKNTEVELETAKNHLERVRKNTSSSIEKLGKTKLEIYSREIKKFADVFSQIKHFSLDKSVGLCEIEKLNAIKGNIGEMKDISLKAKNIVVGGAAGLSAGALISWGTYGGVMAWGTASTGDAIGTLHGAAAVNATLAWLGGGTLAAGGGGVALGSAVLGGIVAGPALLIAGGIIGAKAKEKLNNAYSNAAEAEKIISDFKRAETELGVISETAGQINRILKGMRKGLGNSIAAMEFVVNNSRDWNGYNEREKHIILLAYKNTELVKGIIDTPLLTEDGILTKDIKNAASIYYRKYA